MTNTAAIPTQVDDVQGDGRWLSMHNRFVREAREMEPDVVFIGDSIIANLQSTDLWEKWFAPMHSLNFGIGGDQTQHVLWRLQNGELECIHPKAIVVCVGTNNHNHTDQEIAEAITEIASTIKERQPETYIILLTLLPRGEKPNHLREKFEKINALVTDLAKDIPRCQVVNTNRDLVLLDGSIDHRDMYDYLHLTWQGYRRSFEPVYELLTQLLHEHDPTLLNNISCCTTPTTPQVPSPVNEQPPGASNSQ